MTRLTSADSAFFSNNVQLRFLGPTDIDELKALCTDWFPIVYPDVWYKDVTSNKRFFSLGATYNNKIIGVVIAEVRSRNACNKEDSDILGYWYPVNTQVAYILILGAAKEYRRKGIGSLLLDSLLSHVKLTENKSCKAVYLHVLTTNTSAVVFYEVRNFRRHSYLPMYYGINGKKMDGFCYVLYVNGGEPPWRIKDFCTRMASLFSPVLITRVAGRFFCRVLLLPRTIFLTQNNSRTICNL